MISRTRNPLSHDMHGPIPALTLPPDYVAPTETEYRERGQYHKTRRPYGYLTHACYASACERRHATQVARVVAYNATLDRIRSLLAEQPYTEGQLYTALRDIASADIVREVLRAMMGSRVGRETTGEVVVVGWCAGSECYGLRPAEVVQ